MKHFALGFAAWLFIVYRLWKLHDAPVPFARRTAPRCRANWFGLRCWMNECGFRPNTIGPIGGHCCTIGCERQVIWEDDGPPGPWRRHDPKPAPVRPKDHSHVG